MERRKRWLRGKYSKGLRNRSNDGHTGKACQVSHLLSRIPARDHKPEIGIKLTNQRKDVSREIAAASALGQ